MAKIAITLAAPNKTGASRMVKYYVDALISRGHQVRLLHGTPPAVEADQTASIIDEWESDQVETVCIPELSKPMPPKVYQTVSKASQDCDLFCGVNQRDRAVALKVAHHHGVPGILNVQNQQVFWGNQIVRSIKRRYYSSIIRKYCDVFVCSSVAVQEQLTREFGISPKRCVILRNAIEIPDLPNCYRRQREAIRSEFGLDLADRLYLNVGRLDEQKGQDLLLEAWADSKRETRDHLLLIGDASTSSQATASEKFKSKLTEYVIAKQITDSVHFLGWRDDVRELLLASDCYLHSARWEGFPLAVMEAMACSLPTVMTDCSGRPNDFEDGQEGFVVAANQIPPLQDAINYMSQASREILDSMGKKARSFAESHFDIEQSGGVFCDVVEAVLDNPTQDFRKYQTS